MVTEEQRKSGSKFGKQGGRPRIKKGITNAECLNGEPYGMAATEYNEYLTFLDSPQSAPLYPSRITGKSKSVNEKDKRKYKNRTKSMRKDFKKKCSNYTVENGVLFRFVKFYSSQQDCGESRKGTIYKARVPRQGEVNEELFRQFHHDKGHIGQRQGRETLRQH